MPYSSKRHFCLFDENSLLTMMLITELSHTLSPVSGLYRTIETMKIIRTLGHAS